MSKSPARPAYVRYYQHRDRESVRRLVWNHMMQGPESTLEAVLRGQIQSFLAYACYAIGTTGLSLVASTFLLRQILTKMKYKLSRSALCLAGALLSVTSLGLWLCQRWLCRRTLTRYAKETLAGDIGNIAGHYELKAAEGVQLSPAGKKAFWVVEATEWGKAEGEVVGCVGLDISDTVPDAFVACHSPFALTITPHDKFAILKHFIVPADSRAENASSYLIQHVITHAVENGIKGISLQTTSLDGTISEAARSWGWHKGGETLTNVLGVKFSSTPLVLLL